MQYYPFKKPRVLLTSGGLGAMGYGLGAAIGGCLAKDRRRTVLFTSDGSLGMNLNEIATAVSLELPLVIIILNNGVLGMVRQWQGMFFGARYSQTTLNRKTNFAALADAFGAKGYWVNSISQLRSILENLPTSCPAVIDCKIDMDEKVLPMIPPGGSAKNIILRR
jgi:acetolactate synthase-1/2/3 large subunit